MASIYFHIPYCIKKCDYCDFYSKTDLSDIDEYLKCLQKELILRKEYIDNEKIKSIYFGGGTPSVINPEKIDHLIDEIYKAFEIEANVEITIEVNPDDINENYIKYLKMTKINRISLGLQSIFDKYLKFLNRRHNTDKSFEAVKMIKNSGYKNISIDLIYGIPFMSLDEWDITIDKVVEMDIDHISAYHLTIEPKTKLYDRYRKKEFELPEEEISKKQYDILVGKLNEAGFEHYEISNFARHNLYSIHNLGYWNGSKYLGLGAAAHSFNGISRQWNISDTKKYIKSIDNNKLPFIIEFIDEKTKFNEHIMTRLRTKWGINLKEMQQSFNRKIFEAFTKSLERQIACNNLIIDGEYVYIPEKQFFISDYIIRELFI